MLNLINIISFIFILVLFVHLQFLLGHPKLDVDSIINEKLLNPLITNTALFGFNSVSLVLIANEAHLSINPGVRRSF